MAAVSMMSAEVVWHNPAEARTPVLQNQQFSDEIGRTYVRLPDRAHGKVSDAVWNLSRNSAGIAVDFISDAPRIDVRYVVTGPMSMPHMPATGVSGVDLYSTDGTGEWRRHWGGYSFGDTVRYSFANTGAALPEGADANRHFRLYLPLYNTVDRLEVGTPDGSAFEFVGKSEEKPVVVYGTSIAHGACASRPGMAWTNILNRALGSPVVNLGFSGNGRLAPEMIDFINEIDGSVYVLDCLPNLLGRSSEEIKNLATAAVRQIRTKHDAPVILVEHIGNSNSATEDSRLRDVANLNRGLREAYDSLGEDGVKDVHYISRQEIGMQPDDWVDYIHPSDLGMARQAAVVAAKIKEILR